MIKVLIADDHAVVLEGLKQILSETPDIIVSAQATNGREVLDKLRTNNAMSWCSTSQCPAEAG